MKILFEFFIQILRSMRNLPGMFKRQQNELNQDHFSGRIDLNSIATKLTNVLVKQAPVVQRRTQIYYELGMKGGADFDKLDKDAGNDSWKFFHILLLQYFSTQRDTRKAKEELIACLRNLGLEFCASELEKLDLTTCYLRFRHDIFWHNMEDACQNFAGRKNELAILEENFHKQKRSTRYTVLTSVVGMGGIGKTTLAREFAHHFRERYNGSVAWIPAENSSLVSNEFSQIANKLNLPKVSSTRDFTKSIYESLLSKNDKVLFIFDNFDDPNTEWIHDFLPNGLAQKRPFVLITSRRRDITFPSNAINLGALSSEEALQMIQKVLPNVSSKMGNKLAETLKCYPLSIQIAISEIRYLISLSQDEAAEEYIKNIDRNYAILLDENENVTLDYNKSGTTLQKQHDIGLRKLVESLLIVLVALLLTYSLANFKVDEKLQKFFTKSLDCDSQVLKTTEEFVRLKHELQHCFNILDINMGDFESNFKYFLDNVQLKSTNFVSLPLMEKANGVPKIIKDHKLLENVMSKLKPGWKQLYKA